MRGWSHNLVHEANLSSLQYSKFGSEPFTIYIGPNKTAHHVNRQLLMSNIPYFASLLSFPGLESTSTNSAHLDTPADTEDAFEMILQFIYSRRYSPPAYLAETWQAQTHAEVYVMAERLLMEDLKEVTVKNMARTLLNATGVKTATRWDIATQGWVNETVPKMDVDCIVQTVGIIYGSTVEEVAVQNNDEEKGGDSMGKESERTREAETKSGEIPWGETNRKQSTATPRKDPMRVLLAKYCGANLVNLRKFSGFMRLVQEVGAFSKDLIMEVLPRGGLTEGEVYAV